MGAWNGDMHMPSSSRDFDSNAAVCGTTPTVSRWYESGQFAGGCVPFNWVGVSKVTEH